MRRICTRQSSHGFTLIELLVVISIIALLISILLPALQSARTAAQVTVALSQVKQITLALRSYATDYGDRLPFANADEDDQWDGGPYWSDLLLDAGYVGTKDVFYSPEHDRGVAYASMKFSGFGVNHLCPMPTRQQVLQNNSKYGLPIRFGEAGNPSPQDILLLADSSWHSMGLFDGAFILGQKLFSYNGSVAQGYVDGHGSASNGEALGWQAFSTRDGEWLIDRERYWAKPWWDRKYHWPPYNNPGDDPWGNLAWD